MRRWISDAVALTLAVCLTAPAAFSQDVRNTFISLAAQVADGILTNAKLASMSTTTIKGQTVGGSGAPVDLTAAQAATVIGSVGGAIKTKVLSITRDLTLASGNVGYTGMGFQPLACAATGTVSGTALTQYTNVASFVDSTLTAGGVIILASQTGLETSFLTFTDATATNSQNASVASFDADGLTLTWTKTATPTGTATIKLLCFR